MASWMSRHAPTTHGGSGGGAAGRSASSSCPAPGTASRCAARCGPTSSGGWTSTSAELEAALQLLLQLLAVAAAEGQPRAVLQDDDVLAVEPRLQLFHAFGVDDPRPVN